MRFKHETSLSPPTPQTQSIPNLERLFPHTQLEGTWSCSSKLSEPPGLQLWVENSFIWDN